METSLPAPNIPRQKNKYEFKLAILMGLLTFLVTGIIMIAIAIPLFLLQKISDDFYPGMIIARLLNLQGLGGFFTAEFILIAVLFLLGDFGTAFLSWLINRSKKLAGITFLSALIFQIITISIIIPITMKKSQETAEAGIARGKAYQQYAVIGEVSVEPQVPFTLPYALNGIMKEVALFKKLIFTIPITVTHDGIYKIFVEYSSNSTFYANSTSSPSLEQNLNVGAHVIKIEFIAGEALNLGYELPHTVQGRATIKIDYLASKNELLDSLDDNGQNMLQQILNERDLNENINSESLFNQFVGKKEVKF